MGTEKANTKNASNAASSDEVTIGFLANVLGISLRTAQRHSQSGLFTVVRVKNRSNMYCLSECVQNYINHKISECEQKCEKDKLELQKSEKLQVDISLKESQLELSQIKTEIAKGKYIPIEDVHLDVQRFFVVFKKFAMAIPSRMGGIVAGYVEPVIVRGIEKDLTKEINDMLRTFIVAGQPADGGDKK